MDTQIEFLVRGEHSHTTEAVREYALRRLSFAVKRFEHRVLQVTVRLVDENGPRRGVADIFSMVDHRAGIWRMDNRRGGVSSGARLGNRDSVSSASPGVVRAGR